MSQISDICPCCYAMETRKLSTLGAIFRVILILHFNFRSAICGRVLVDRWYSLHHYQWCLAFFPLIRTNETPGSVHACLDRTCIYTSTCPFSFVHKHIIDNCFVCQVGQRESYGRQSSKRIECSTCFQYETNAMKTTSATSQVLKLLSVEDPDTI